MAKYIFSPIIALIITATFFSCSDPNQVLYEKFWVKHSENQSKSIMVFQKDGYLIDINKPEIIFKYQIGQKKITLTDPRGNENTYWISRLNDTLFDLEPFEEYTEIKGIKFIKAVEEDMIYGKWKLVSGRDKDYEFQFRTDWTGKEEREKSDYMVEKPFTYSLTDKKLTIGNVKYDYNFQDNYRILKLTARHETLVLKRKSAAGYPPSNLAKKNMIDLVDFDCGTGSDLGYWIVKPDENHKLPGILYEISGITTIGDDKLACIQDELGIVFIYDYVKRKVDGQINFSYDGDYEGIASTGDNLYVLRSDGVIFEIGNFKSRDRTVKSYHTLIEAATSEGLCYDKENNRLLISSKSKSKQKNTENKYKRYVYAFDLKTKKLDSNPLIEIDYLELTECFSDFGKQQDSLKQRNIEDDEIIKFRPSEIAINPINNLIYIISSMDNLLLVYGEELKITHAEVLSPRIFEKPEGMAFLDNGDMFISNEGVSGKANILRFNYKKAN